ncbi:hypothetical protein AtEden1_Chr1g0039151 [Arabidopsis thaliana]
MVLKYITVVCFFLSQWSLFNSVIVYNCLEVQEAFDVSNPQDVVEYSQLFPCFLYFLFALFCLRFCIII